jgi:aldehyde:ferredoxin oxidoreductase
VTKINGYGKLSTRNNITEVFPEADKISGDILKEKYITGNTACSRCPVACGKKVKVPGGKYTGEIVKMPEYETLYSLGSMLANSDILSIINGNNACDSLGLDTISMGVTLSFAAECMEKGLLLPDSGEKIVFGNSNNIAELVEKTAFRKGIGNMLAEGSEAMASDIGGDTFKYLYTVKGLEVAGHSARGIRHMGLAYATSTRGGSHHDARPKYYEPENEPDRGEIPLFCVNSQHFTSIGDSLIMCRFVMERGFGTELNEPLCGLVNAVTGFDYTLDELVQTGERIYNLERLINCGRGADINADTLPYRVSEEPIPEGPSAGMVCGSDSLEEMLREYYELRGWDERGIPSEEKIRELGIEQSRVHAGRG